MNKLIFLIFFILTNLYSTEIEVSSRVNISEFNLRKVKHSYCIFSEGESSTNTSGVSASGHGESSSLFQKFSHRGKKYLKRNVNWDSKTTENSFNLSFFSEDANFSEKQKFGESHCAYRMWKGQSTSATTKLTAKAAFQVPNNVWIIRIRSKTNLNNAKLQLDLSNEELIDQKIIVQKFYSFSGNLNEQYFLVNASSGQQDAFVYLNLEYLSNSMEENKFFTNFEIDFISAFECFNDLKNKKIHDLLNVTASDKKLDDALVNLACMMNTNYVKHTLNSLHLYKMNEFNDELDMLKEEIKSYTSSSNSEFNKYIVFLKLLDRVQFYYNYEILKETFDLLSHKITYDGIEVDSFLYIEILRKRGIDYLDKILYSLYDDVKKLLSETEAFVLIPEDFKLKSDIYLKTLLPLEVNNFERSHSLIYRPLHLGTDSYDSIFESIDYFTNGVQRLYDFNETIQNSEYITHPQTRRYLAYIRNSLMHLVGYHHAFVVFRNNIPDEVDPLQIKTNILAQIETSFNLHINGLIDIVGEYFVANFEDPMFQETKVGDKTYKNAGEFISDYRRLIKEVQN